MLLPPFFVCCNVVELLFGIIEFVLVCYYQCMNQQQKVDVLIVGAGQSGLALGYYLRKSPLSFVILEKNNRVGDNWRRHYDSLEIFSPRGYDSLPGIPLPGETEGYPKKDEFAAYLENYVSFLDLPVHTNVAVIGIEKTEQDFTVRTTEGVYSAKQVVLAAGAYQKPWLPGVAHKVSEVVYQTHSASYKNPGQVPFGPVLVVGGGNSGAQIATELSKHLSVTLASRRPLKFFPKKIFGKSLFWWLDVLGLLHVSARGFFRKFTRSTNEFIVGKELQPLIRSGRVTIKPELVNIDGDTAVFADGSKGIYKSIIWATGYRQDFSYVHIPEVFDAQGGIIQNAGITPARGLYVLGLKFSRTSSSGLIRGAGPDAQHLHDIITQQAKR